jgi:tetratricopeptide (TPR) repeat protein
MLSEAQRRERHLALFDLYAHAPDMHPYLVVHHLFDAGQPERALDLLAKYESMGEQKDSDAALRAGPARLARALEHALEFAIAFARPPRELHELRRRLCGLATIDDYVRSDWVLPVWLAQLEHDSGLRDYRALDTSLDSGTRLQQALTAAATRFGATPEHERVYRVDEAIKHLAVYVVSEIVRTWRTRNPDGVRGLPELLEPFVSLSPPLLAIWHNARGAQAIVAGRALESRARFADVWEQLGDFPIDTLRFVTGVRMGAARMIARQDASMGRSSALDWAKHLDSEPLHRADGMSLRRVLCMMLGDAKGADHFGRQAELLSLRSNARQPFDPEWPLELAAYELVQDLAGARRVIEAIAPLAKRYPGWQIELLITQATYDAMRGNLEAAAIALCDAEARTRPADSNASVWVEQWIGAALGLMTVYTEQGNFSGAVTLGEESLAICARQGVDYGWLRIAEMLALAEAKLDQRQRAIARLENVIDTYRQLGVQGLLLAQAYAMRARIANWVGESATAQRFATLAAAQPGGESLRSIMTSTDVHFGAAHFGAGSGAFGLNAASYDASGVPDAPSQTTFGSKLREELLCCPTKQSRTAFALEHLGARTGSDHAQLYLVDSAKQLALAAASSGAEPDADAMQFACAFFKQQTDEEDFDTQLVHATQMLSLPGAASYVDKAGRRSHLYMLTCKDNGALMRVGLAVLRVTGPADFQPQLAAELSVLALSFLRTGDSPGVRAA